MAIFRMFEALSSLDLSSLSSGCKLYPNTTLATYLPSSIVARSKGHLFNDAPLIPSKCISTKAFSLNSSWRIMYGVVVSQRFQSSLHWLYLVLRISSLDWDELLETSVQLMTHICQFSLGLTEAGCKNNSFLRVSILHTIISSPSFPFRWN